MLDSSLLLRDVYLDDNLCDVLIADGHFKRIAANIPVESDYEVIDCASELSIIPPFYNLHSHAAMTLLRGFADDLELFTWLEKHIWPAEALLTYDDIYWGTKLALLEMIKSGSVFVNDMYWQQCASLEAVEEMGLRAAIGYMFICVPGGGILESNQKANDELRERSKNCSDRIKITYAPHAIYTVNEKILREIAEEAQDAKAVLHIHAAETLKEVEDCRKQHGMSPIEYLDSLNILNEKTVLAHCTHLTDRDIEIIAEKKALIAHNPVSNLKLCSGLFRFNDADNAGCKIGLGTDGCASNNNLSMLEEMKFAALLAKIQANDPKAGKAETVFNAATKIPCDAFGIEGGEIKENKVADAILVKRNHPQMIGNYNEIANLVYSADNSVIDTMICDGKVLMNKGNVENEEEILEKNLEICKKISEKTEKN